MTREIVLVNTDREKPKVVRVPGERNEQTVKIGDRTYHHVAEDAAGRWVYAPLR